MRKPRASAGDVEGLVCRAGAAVAEGFHPPLPQVVLAEGRPRMGFGGVDDVVVDQRRGVDHFDDRAESDHAMESLIALTLAATPGAVLGGYARRRLQRR